MLTMPERFTADEVRAQLRDDIADAGSLRSWAWVHKVSPSFVSAVLTGRKPPSDKIAKALGLERVVLFEDPGTRR